MNARLFRLLETHQRIDRALRDELKRRRRDPIQAIQLKRLKLRVRDLMSWLNQRTASA